MNQKVLLIDDEPEWGRMVEAVLRPLEITVYQAYSGPQGLKTAYEFHPDLVILDIVLPEMDGFEVCLRLREMACMPILMLTARTSDKDMLRGFSVGVDDFVKKPFRGAELEARVRALLRRSSKSLPETLYLHSYSDSFLEIDLSSQTVKLRGEVVELSPREYAVLACLVRERQRLVTHRELIRDVWGEFQINAASLVSLYIHYLRKRLEDGKHGHRYIRTQWGRGYWFESRKED